MYGKLIVTKTLKTFLKMLLVFFNLLLFIRITFTGRAQVNQVIHNSVEYENILLLMRALTG